MQTKICSLFGPDKFQITDKWKQSTMLEIELLIESMNVREFLFGDENDFYNVMYNILVELKMEYPDIILSYSYGTKYGLNENGFIEYCDKFDRFYMPEDETIDIFSLPIDKFNMIDNSDFCLFYYKRKYSHLKDKKTGKRIISGLKLSLNYARMRDKEIFMIK